MPHQQFSKKEAEEKIGRQVKTLVDLDSVPRGTLGKIILADKTQSGYDLAIEWEIPISDSRFLRTWINKQLYDEALVEI